MSKHPNKKVSEPWAQRELHAQLSSVRQGKMSSSHHLKPGICSLNLQLLKIGVNKKKGKKSSKCFQVS